MSANELKQLLDFGVQVAGEAGDITTRYFKQSIAAERKADNSFVTIADREAERHIRSRIEKAFPDDGILGEEEDERPSKSGRRWIIDPIMARIHLFMACRCTQCCWRLKSTANQLLEL